MLRTIITSALRNLGRHVSFSVINLTGLALSMSLSLLIILVLKSQYSFDTFHRDSDRVFRINTEAIRVSGDTEPYASAPLSIASKLNDDYALTEEVVKLDRRFSGNVKVGDASLFVRGLFATDNFLQVFNFPLAAGSPESALSEPNTIVISSQTAKRIFGEANPVGETMEFENLGDLTVTGVLEPFPGPTHFEFAALASFATLESLERNGVLATSSTDPKNYYSGYAYVRTRPGISREDIEHALAEISAGQYADVQYETRDKGYRFYVQGLGEITPGPPMSNNMGKGMPDLLLIFLGALATIVMIMACFNYTQLTIAKSLTRAKEIGIRKIVGAHRFQVFLQLVVEGIVFSLVALIIAYFFLQIIKPGFEQLHINMEYAIDLTEDYKVLLLFIGFTVLVGTLAGLIPAAYLSAFKPLHVMRGGGNLKVYSRLTFRKILMITQFTLSFVFVVLIITVYRQVNFMVTADYGFKEDGIMNVPLQGNDFQKFSNAVRNVPGVIRVGGISHRMGTWADGSSDYRRDRGDDPFTMRDFSIDENFLVNINAKFLAGKNFGHGDKNGIVLNRKSLELFGFSDPLSAINQAVYLGDSTELIVRGVVENFHFRPLSYEIGPLALRYDPDNINLLSLQITGNETLVASKVEAVWKKLDSKPFEWAMMSREIDQAYEDAGFQDIISIIGYITVIAITLSCLGMLGMVMYTTETRVKEVGVRKILGANVKDVLLLLSRSFFVMVAVALVIGLPVSIALSDIFLETYAYKVPFSFLTIGGGVLSLILVTGLIIASQTMKAATSNPVNSLRHE